MKLLLNEDSVTPNWTFWPSGFASRAQVTQIKVHFTKIHRRHTIIDLYEKKTIFLCIILEDHSGKPQPWTVFLSKAFICYEL